jgi:hypothetical protein
MSRFAAAAPPLAVALVAAAFFFTGITWGLPSRASDAYLFGTRRPWTGVEILNLAGDWDDASNRGADIAMHPLAGRDKPIVVNATDAQRAAIVRRFRLYSCQPDEMITFRALSRMKPGRGDLDPHFFQYGGLWVYPVGVLLKLASLLHLVTLRGYLAFYLDHPQAFGRFYIVARAYSAAWGVIGSLVVYALMVQWMHSRFASSLGALLYCTMPVVVNAAHEAKPHLAGAVLTLATIGAAMRYVQGGRRRWAMLAGALAGAAAGMILTGIVAFAVLPVMALLRPMRWSQRAAVSAVAAIVAAMVFLCTNPYLPLDYLLHREIVQSNVGNYGNFYRPALSAAGLRNAVLLIDAGMSTLPAVAALPALAWLLRQGAMHRRASAHSLGWLLAAPALLVAVQFILLASAKPAEYARFALLLDVILAVCLAAVTRTSAAARGAVMLVVACSTIASATYLTGYLEIGSARAGSSRAFTARLLDRPDQRNAPLLVWAEPAPYCMPAANLFTHQIILLPRGASSEDAHLSTDAIALRPVDWQPGWLNTPISWANKPFELTWVKPERPYNWK